MRSVARPGFRRKQQPAPIWQTLNRLVVFLIFLAGGGLLFLFFQPELNKLADMRRYYAELQASQEKETIEQLRLARTKTLLESDPEYLENIARDKLELMKPGETIYRLESRTSE